MTNYSFTITPKEHIVIIRFKGRLSRYDIKILRDEILNTYSGTETNIIVNMDLGEPSSLLVAIFLEVLDVREKDGRSLAFCEMDTSTEKALIATGILKYALTFSHESEALEHFNHVDQ